MNNYNYIKNFVGKNITEDDLSCFDCYSTPNFGLLIPIKNPDADAVCKYPRHPCYTLFIFFEKDTHNMNYYYGELFSPDVPHDNRTRLHHYCLMFEKEYFEERFKMYSDDPEIYNLKSIKIYGDMLKLLNSFALEYSRNETNSEITLEARAEIITHKVIRSILCENISAAKPVSEDYSIAAAQNYMERHYAEDINVTELANLGYELVSCFMRRFKKETGVTPMEYLGGIRMKNARKLLKESYLSVMEIAEKCGFEAEEKFRVRFKEKLGVTPEQYREVNKEVKKAADSVKAVLI
ncbi:MAG: helix-turn-helix transcriptional regulator [Ruminococcus sp.]|nr:helix-turn-helix transcriptional regulator [Ruminococcus sp.]